jgi:tripeptide aminopeptidase
MNEKRAVEHLMRLLAIPGSSGAERPVADEVIRQLLAAGVKREWISEDRAHRKIPVPFEMGNLIVKLPGTVKSPRILFASHLDTVPLCRGAIPVRRGGRIVPKGKTGLGADNRTAVAALVSLAESLLKNKTPHPPITLLFTVGEESGLWGARFVEAKDLGNPVMGFNIDGGDPNEICIGAVGAERWEVDVRGISAHAGCHPEKGVSAILIASRAMADIAHRGWFGKIRKGTKSGTSNAGVITGGEATNQVTDHVFVKGESRSHNSAFCNRITREIELCFRRAAKSVRNDAGRCGSIEFRSSRSYDAFRIASGEPVVRVTSDAMRRLGMKPSLKIIDGGLDANYFNAKGIPTVTLGAGQHEIHTLSEYAEISEYLSCCRLVAALATCGI